MFLGAHEFVLVGVDDAVVGFDGFEGSFGQAAQLVGVEPLGFLDQRCLDGFALFGGDSGGELVGGVQDDCGVGGGDQSGVEGLGGGLVAVAGLQLGGQVDLPRGGGA